MNIQGYFATTPVFTNDDFARYLKSDYSPNSRSREALISYHVRRGNLVRVRRGLYIVVSPGTDPETCPFDPILVAGKFATDAVLAYHTALDVHGKSHSIFRQFYFQSAKHVRATTFRTHQFECVPFPKALRTKRLNNFATKTIERLGVDVRVATLERTLVDLLDRPKLGGGWEEIWRSLESIEYFDLDLVVEYTGHLSNATTAAKVGYFLDTQREPLKVDERHLKKLRALTPKRPHYLERGKHGKLIPAWNLVVPDSLIARTWDDLA